MGKTTLAVEIIRQRIMRSVTRCFAVCPTWYEQPALKPLRMIKGAFPRKRVFTNPDESSFEKIYTMLMKEKRNGLRIPTLLIVDDCAAEKSMNMRNHGVFGRLAISSPHLNLSIFTVVQKMTTCSPLMRENTEGVITFLPDRVADVEILADEYNPKPYLPGTAKYLRRILAQCWNKNRFSFLWREKLTGHVAYHAGFGKEVAMPREWEENYW
jgi:hypothetical protein